jgi:HPt (histidine-containing phosphotransfer) domain-containing protein
MAMHGTSLNLTRLTDLLGDDRGAIGEILDLAVGTCRKAMGALRVMDASTPTGDVAHAAHAMKGAAANVGAEALSAVAAVLEEEARGGSIGDLLGTIASIGREFDRFEGAVRTFHQGDAK